MKRIYLALISIVIAFPLLAQTHNDYIEDGVTGGVDRAFNGILWMIIIAVVAVILLFVIGGIQKFIWWYDPSTSPEYKEKQKKRLEESRKPINKPTPKPQVEAPKIQPTEPIKKDIELEIVAKEVWVNVNSENRVNKEVVYSYIDSINFDKNIPDQGVSLDAYTGQYPSDIGDYQNEFQESLTPLQKKIIKGEFSDE